MFCRDYCGFLGTYHDDKAKAVIEEIEELKREEQAYLGLQRGKKSRSRTPSRRALPGDHVTGSDKSKFKKLEKKARNYRRRSPTPEKPKKIIKKAKKYPKNWREFYELDATFELNREFEIEAPVGNNE